MPFPDFLRSDERINLHERRKSPPFVSEFEPMEAPPAGPGDVLTGDGDDLLRGAGPSGRELDLSCEEQKGDYWCWAAVAASVARFYDPQVDWEQCELVNRYLRVDRCCGSNADMETCDKPQRLDVALGITGNFVRYLYHPQRPEPPIQFEMVRSEIDKGRVVCSRVEFESGGHFQIIIGWKTAGGENHLIISDPIYLRNTIVFSSFASKYEGGGTWNVAYITTPARAGAQPAGVFQILEPPSDPILASTGSSIPADGAVADTQHWAEVGDPADLLGG